MAGNNDAILEMNLALQKIALASDKFYELKRLLEESRSHFVKANEPVPSPGAEGIVQNYDSLAAAIQQVEEAFKKEAIARMVFSTINKKRFNKETDLGYD